MQPPNSADVFFAEAAIMEHKGVEFTVVQTTDGTGWRWEVRFGRGKNKSGVTPLGRAAAIKLCRIRD
jgi:hypothetical protein